MTGTRFTRHFSVQTRYPRTSDFMAPTDEARAGACPRRLRAGRLRQFPVPERWDLHTGAGQHDVQDV